MRSKVYAGRKIVIDIVEAEIFGPVYKMDAMIVLPATRRFYGENVKQHN